MPVSRTNQKRKPAKSKGKGDGKQPLFLDKRFVDALIATVSESHGKSDPIEAAQEIMYDAWDATGQKKRIALANKALKVSPLCADAYVLLGMEESKSPDEALILFQKGVDAGRRALGPQGFSEFAGHLSSALETRPFRRAMHWRGLTLTELGWHQEAIKPTKKCSSSTPTTTRVSAICWPLSCWLATTSRR
jgi:hypothetical protein